MQCTGGLHSEYEREAASTHRPEAFPSWLRARCSTLAEGEGANADEIRALACGPSTRVCSFRSMVSHGCHYRVEEDEGAATHVTYDCGVAELQVGDVGGGSLDQSTGVQIKRVGTLKDILVLNYAHSHIVLMVVSWLTADNEEQPRLRRDAHGFWLANMAAMPRCSRDPYILPSLASQVASCCCDCIFIIVDCRCASK